MGFKLIPKLPLIYLRHVFSIKPPSNFAAMCWEPELQEADKPYDNPGKWDVDETCVSTLQTISVETLGVGLTDLLLSTMNDNHPAIDEILYHALRLQEIRDVSKHVFLFLKEYSDFFLQAFWYASFKRFLRYAQQRHRHGDNASIVSVSCKG